jgi:hypothetical protein
MKEGRFIVKNPEIEGLMYHSALAGYQGAADADVPRDGGQPVMPPLTKTVPRQTKHRSTAKSSGG